MVASYLLFLLMINSEVDEELDSWIKKFKSDLKNVFHIVELTYGYSHLTFYDIEQKFRDWQNRLQNFIILPSLILFEIVIGTHQVNRYGSPDVLYFG